MTRIAVISDTHAMHNKVTVPPCDILIHCGDIMSSGYEVTELILFNAWLATVPAKHKVLCWGNHDRFAQDSPGLAKQLVSSATVLTDEEVTIEGLRIYGTPYTRTFFDWAFMESEEQLDRRFNNIPEGLDILVCHGPAYGLCDTLMDDTCAGSQALHRHLIRATPKIVLSGHIHNAYGMVRTLTVTDDLGEDAPREVTCYGVSTCTESYRPTNPPIIIDLD